MQHKTTRCIEKKFNEDSSNPESNKELSISVTYTYNACIFGKKVKP